MVECQLFNGETFGHLKKPVAPQSVACPNDAAEERILIKYLIVVGERERGAIREVENVDDGLVRACDIARLYG